jgi:hypothetical protein
LFLESTNRTAAAHRCRNCSGVAREPPPFEPDQLAGHARILMAAYLISLALIGCVVIAISGEAS